MHDSTQAALFFARVSRELMGQAQELPSFHRVTERAVEVVDGCDWASLALRRGRHRVETIAATHHESQLCDSLQYELGEGPSLGAVWDGECYVSQDVGSDARWPRWGNRVAEVGVGSVVSIRLSSSTETLGALTCYSRCTNAFTPDGVEVAVVFAAHAANAINAARTVTGLQTALQSRHLIGVAQGILMHRFGLSLDQALEVLRRYSSHSNTKLTDVAQHVVYNGDLPDADDDHNGRVIHNGHKRHNGAAKRPGSPVTQARTTT
jgi:GAF domain-containing protein